MVAYGREIPDGTVTPEVISRVTATVTLLGAIAADDAVLTLTVTLTVMPALALACRCRGGFAGSTAGPIHSCKLNSVDHESVSLLGSTSPPRAKERAVPSPWPRILAWVC